MPAGVSWTQYIFFGVSALASMAAGAQCVHLIYKPLDDINDLIEQKFKEVQEGAETNETRS